MIGRQFLHRLLERITGLTGELEGLPRELKSLEIIYEQGLLTEPAYIFKHAIIQDVAYNSLLVQRRKELHRAVAHAIEELYPDRLADDEPAAGTACPARSLFAQRSCAAGARQYQESVAAYEAAGALARRIGDRRLEADVLIALGGVYNFYHLRIAPWSIWTKRWRWGARAAIRRSR